MTRNPSLPRTLRLEALEDRLALSTLTVVNDHDSGTGSLRALLAAAAPGDTITFANNVHSIDLTSGELLIDKSLAIQGPGANRLTISGSHASRVFDVTAGNVSISGLTVANGLADVDSPLFPAVGGGILNQGNLTLTGVVVADNRAVGDASVVLPLGGYVLAGAGLGGGVANLGTIDVQNSTFRNNTAVGADNSAGLDFPNIMFPGMALGGGLYNLLSTATVAGSVFVGNTAVAGDHSTGSFAGLGGGGGIYNDAALTVTGSSFLSNQAIGGNDNVADIHSGHGVGGGIVSGSVTAAFGLRSASLSVSTSLLAFNRAVGGDNNRVTVPVEFVSGVDGPSDGFGGGIFVYQGIATIAATGFASNQAVGGLGGGDQKGSRAGGGGLFALNFIGPVTTTVTGSTFFRNSATGGNGTASIPGGHAFGGAVFAGGLGGAFSAPGAITIQNSFLAFNVAEGGAGATGGDGLGGGLFNDTDSTMSLAATLVAQNTARGGRGATAGRGIGGGVYNLGVFAADVLTFLLANRASTSNDNRFG